MEFNALAPNPYTVSVGKATSPPFLIISAVIFIFFRSGFIGSCKTGEVLHRLKARVAGFGWQALRKRDDRETYREAMKIADFNYIPEGELSLFPI